MSERREERAARSSTPARRLVGGLDRLLGVADLLAKGLIGVALLTITAVLFAGGFGRYALNTSFVGGEELARYLMVWMTFLGAYVLVREQRHIAIDVVLRVLPRGFQRWIAVAIGALGAATMLYLSVTGFWLAERMLASGTMSPVLPIPRGVLHLSLPLGATLMTLAFVHMALAHLLNPAGARPLFEPSDAED